MRASPSVFRENRLVTRKKLIGLISHYGKARHDFEGSDGLLPSPITCQLIRLRPLFVLPIPALVLGPMTKVLNDWTL